MITVILLTASMIGLVTAFAWAATSKPNWYD